MSTQPQLAEDARNAAGAIAERWAGELVLDGQESGSRISADGARMKRHILVLELTRLLQRGNVLSAEELKRNE